MTLSRGIDVSHHQGTVDWAALKQKHGITWGACKATEGLTFTDSAFTRNWSAMQRNGLVRMAYHFGRPGGDAVAQASRFLALVKPVKGDVICLDLEQSDGKSQAEVNAWAKAFGNTLRREAPGITSVVYLGGYSANGSGKGLSLYFDYWWYPRYSTMSVVSMWPTAYAPRLAGNTTGWDAPHIWQWAASLRALPGLDVDANISPLTAAQLSAGPAHLAADTTTEEDMPSLDEIAHAVWAYDQDGKKAQAWGYLQAAAKNDVPAFASELKVQLAALNVTGAPTQDQLEAALTKVIGSVDDK